MIAINTIKVENFRAYKNINLTFKDDRGVILMGGDTGSGKSTLLNAICWCLYGDTPFYAIEDSKSISNITSLNDSKVRVELGVTFDNMKYVFTRTSESSDAARGGVLTAQRDDGTSNWQPLDTINARDAARRFLPKDIRHLFFFNGEQIMNIFKPGDDKDLRSSVEKVSEINLLDKMKTHLKSVSEVYMKDIQRSNKNQSQIETLNNSLLRAQDDVDNAKNHIAEEEAKIANYKDQEAALDKLIEDTAASRELIEKRILQQDKYDDADSVFQDCSLNKVEDFQYYYYKTLLIDDFKGYAEALAVAEKNGRIPPPVKPEVTAQSLKVGICSICGHNIGDKEKEFMEHQHAEFERQQELHYLTAGTYAYHKIVDEVDKTKFSFGDACNKVVDAERKKKEASKAIEMINNQLDSVSESNHDNPEARRNDIRNHISKHENLKGRLIVMYNTYVKTFKETKQLLDKAIAMDTATDSVKAKIDYIDILSEAVDCVKVAMEKNIREKLEKSVSDVFFSVLPDTDFSVITINPDYTVTLKTKDQLVYSTSNLSTGQAKTLGLSLTYGLSKDLGYSTVPLLIDNLYGDIKQTHYAELTKMVSALSEQKQVVIMDLHAEQTRSMFPEGAISQQFDIQRIPEHSETIIKEIA
jgi:DNA sulfur modification protein DndD